MSSNHEWHRIFRMSTAAFWTCLATALSASAGNHESPSKALKTFPEGPGFALTRADLGVERGVSLLEAQREELSRLSRANPFPAASVRAIDPLSHKKVSRVLIGPAFDVRADGEDFDYYRYVTFYDIEVRKERIDALPIQRQECQDRSELFSSYSYSSNYSASITASVSYEGLGLSGTISQARTFSTGRNIPATQGIVADYTPYFSKQDWTGRTFIQTYSLKTKKTAFVTQRKTASAWWVYAFFPLMAKSAYPMPFAVKDADWTFLVERTVIKRCADELPELGI